MVLKTVLAGPIASACADHVTAGPGNKGGKMAVIASLKPDDSFEKVMFTLVAILSVVLVLWIAGAMVLLS